MIRPRSAALALAFILATASYSQAGGWGQSRSGGDWWQNYWTDWHRNNCWMEPFIYPDRASVGNMFQAEISKGWELQCLLGDPHYFEPDNAKLSPAGLTKVHTILTQNPPQFRNIYVERSLDEEITNKRVAATQRALATMVRGGPLPEVLVSDMPLIGTSADQVNGVNTWMAGYQTGIAKPQPKAFQNNSDSGSGGSSQ